MVKASSSSAIDLIGVADRLNAEAEAKRRATINDPDAAVRVVERSQKAARHPEIYKLDTVAVMAEHATRRSTAAQTASKAQEDEFPLLRAFSFGVGFAMLLMLVVELIVYAVG